MKERARHLQNVEVRSGRMTIALLEQLSQQHCKPNCTVVTALSNNSESMMIHMIDLHVPKLVLSQPAFCGNVLLCLGLPRCHLAVSMSD
jgi:hypothetical protein